MDGSSRLRSAHHASPGRLLFHFAELAQKRGCTEIASISAFVEEFVTLRLSLQAAEAKTAMSLREHRIPHTAALKSLSDERWLLLQPASLPSNLRCHLPEANPGTKRGAVEMAQRVVIIMCPSERGPLGAKRLPAPRPQNCR
jgi:hypothetical protein